MVEIWGFSLYNLNYTWIVKHLDYTLALTLGTSYFPLMYSLTTLTRNGTKNATRVAN